MRSASSSTKYVTLPVPRDANSGLGDEGAGFRVQVSGLSCVEGALLDEVKQAAGGGDHDVGAALV